jgi:acetyl-CoA carboxylase biotin carboxyl carrier protein
MKRHPAKSARKLSTAQPKPRPDALVDPAVLHDLIAVFQNAGVSDLEVERNGLRIRLRREGAAAPSPFVEVSVPTVPAAGLAAALTGAPTAEPSTEGLVTVRSPIVGTFYRSASPYAEVYVEEGSYVKKGQVLCIVEAMKLMNEIESDVDGRVAKILMENAKPVEYGEPLFLIEPGAQPEG